MKRYAHFSSKLSYLRAEVILRTEKLGNYSDWLSGDCWTEKLGNYSDWLSGDCFLIYSEC